MAEFEQLRRGFQALNKGMTAGQKLTIGITLIVTVLGFVLLVRWATKPDYALLFSNMDLKEADQIVEALRAEGVPYRISGGGSSVQIPSKEVYEWRMKLASQGVPSSGGIGYEVFDKKDIGISDFVQKVNYRRALEGELARTIRGISGVQHARVHIVIPEDRLFREDQQEATASIVLNLRSGTRVREAQVHGIVNLVAASVEGLEPDRVTVLDSKGNILSNRWQSDSVMGLSSGQLDLQKKVEEYLENKAQSMLATVLGEGRTIVRVSADLNFQKIERTDERYDPDNVAVLSEERRDQSNTGESGEGTGQVEHVITNYHVPRTVEHITNSVGNITRLSVAVLIDGVYNTSTGPNGEVQSEYVPRTREEMTMLTAVVRNAVGFDPLRNDQLEIRNIPFDTGRDIEVEEPVSMTSQPEFWISLGQRILPVLFVVVLLLLLRSKLKKVKLSLPPVMSHGGGVSLAPSSVVEDLAVPRIDEGAPPEAIESAKLLKQISNFATEKPNMAARLLRYWMIEE